MTVTPTSPAALALADPLPEGLRVEPWSDPVGAPPGYDPRSRYVETFWLGILGPSAVFLLRALAARFDINPGGFDLDLEFTARALGIGDRQGRHAPLPRTVRRVIVFDLARALGPGTLAVRRRVPALAPRHLLRLPEALQVLHRHRVDGLSAAAAFPGSIHRPVA